MKRATIALATLNTIEICGGILVVPENICEAADLIRAGLVVAESDYEGPRLIMTKKGAAKLAKWKSE